MSITSPSPLAPILPRLLWRELHHLAPLWLAMYGLGAILTIFVITTEPQIPNPSALTGTILGMTSFASAIFLVTSLLVTFAVDRETRDDQFPLHRGFAHGPIYAIKLILPVVMLLALIAAHFLTGLLTVKLRFDIPLVDIMNPETLGIDGSLAMGFLFFAYLILITCTWTILCSLSTRKVVHALLLTLAALLVQMIYTGVVIEGLLFDGRSNNPSTATFTVFFLYVTLSFLLPLATAIALFHRTRLMDMVSTFRLHRITPHKTIPLATKHPPIEVSTWNHLRWLHLREQRPLIIAGIFLAVTAFVQPILSMYRLNESSIGYVERFPFYGMSILFFLFSGCFTFWPEHAQSNYRFWSDRGLSPTLIFRSRILRYLLIVLSMLTISLFVYAITDSIINKQNSLLYALNNGQLFQVDDEYKSAAYFLALYLLTAIPVAIFWSWLCRHLIMSLVMTAFSMMFCFAYGQWGQSNHWPYLVTHAPFLIAIIACMWYLFPERFRLQPRTRLWLLPALAIPLALFISIGDILVYRVLEVPPVSASLALNGPFESHQALEPENRPFADQLKSIQARLSPRPLPPNWQSFIEIDFLGECYGYGNIDPVLRTWTEEHLALATELETLLLETPIEDMRLSLVTSLDPKFNLGSLPYLLIYSAKRKEQQGDLPGALSAYTATDRFAEFMTLYNAAYITARIQLRARIARNMASYITHPDSHLEDLFPFLRISIHQLPDTPDWSTQLRRTFNQLYAHSSSQSENLGTDLTRRSSRELWQRFPIALLPTERWRYNRVLALWTSDLHDRNNHLLWLENFSRYGYYSILVSSAEVLADTQRQTRSLRLQASTPLFEIYKAQFDWLIDPYNDLKNDHAALVQLTNAQARLLILFAERQTNTEMISIDQLKEFYQRTNTGTQTDRRIDEFLTFNQLKISSINQRHESVRNSLPKETQRFINSHFTIDSTELILPLPNFVSLSLANGDFQQTALIIE